MRRINFLALLLWVWTFMGPWWAVFGLAVTLLVVSKPVSLVLFTAILSVSITIRYLDDQNGLKRSFNRLKDHLDWWWETKPSLLKKDDDNE